MSPIIPVIGITVGASDFGAAKRDYRAVTPRRFAGYRAGPIGNYLAARKVPVPTLYSELIAAKPISVLI